MLYINTKDTKSIGNFLNAAFDIMHPENHGLYIPSFFNKLTAQDINNCTKMQYYEIVAHIIEPFCESFLDKKE